MRWCCGGLWRRGHQRVQHLPQGREVVRVHVVVKRLARPLGCGVRRHGVIQFRRGNESVLGGRQLHHQAIKRVA